MKEVIRVLGPKDVLVLRLRRCIRVDKEKKGGRDVFSP